MTTRAIGIDIGGSGIKGAVVELTTGELVTERKHIPTPSPSTPQAIADVVKQIVDHFATEAPACPVGITIPTIVKGGWVRTVANLDQAWVGVAAEELFSTTLGRHISLVNDADAAGLAEAKFGAASGHPGLVIVTTLGTGIGSAMVYQGILIPNAELGHLELDGYDAESRAAASIKDREGLSYEEYIPRLQRYYGHVDFLFSPDLIVVGGGISKESDLFLPQLKLNCPIVPAALRNSAGIVGAAWYAAQQQQG